MSLLGVRAGGLRPAQRARLPSHCDLLHPVPASSPAGDHGSTYKQLHVAAFLSDTCALDLSYFVEECLLTAIMTHLRYQLSSSRASHKVHPETSSLSALRR